MPIVEGIREMIQADIQPDVTQLSDCLVLTHDGKILMQQRTVSWGRSAGNLNVFGGHVEHGESATQAVIRELGEELGAAVDPADLRFIAIIAEEMTEYREPVHLHFWHDRHKTITGCYEAEAAYYDRIAGAFAHPQLMPYARWLLLRCQELGLVK